MSFSSFGDLNWLAVIVAALAYFAIGGLWYAEKVFGAAWMRSMDWTPDPDQRTSAAMYLGPLVTCLISSIGVGLLAVATDSDDFGEGVTLGLVVGVGVAAAVSFVTGYFDPKKPKPMVWASITAGYHVVGLLVAAVIVSVGR